MRIRRCPGGSTGGGRKTSSCQSDSATRKFPFLFVLPFSLSSRVIFRFSTVPPAPSFAFLSPKNGCDPHFRRDVRERSYFKKG